MAQTYLNTGTQAGNFDDLIDLITEVNYKETSFLSGVGRSKAKGILHEWMTQALKSGASNATAEGATPTFAAANVTVRVRRSNNVQIMSLPFSVSGTQDWVNKAGLGQSSEYEYQMDLKMKELALDIDFELIRNTAVTRDGDAGTAGELDGILAWATTQDGANGQLTEKMFDELCNTLGDAGSTPDKIFCNGYQRRTIKGWATPIRRAELGQTTYQNKVDVYDGGWGSQTIVWNKHMPATQIVTIDTQYVKVAYARPIEHYELGRDGDRRRGYVLAEATLEVLAPQTVGRINNLSAS